MPRIYRTLAISRVRKLAASGEARQIRQRARLSQSELAADIGTSQSALSLWEAGARRPTGETAIRWLEALDQLERAL
jgi:DNA-binding transcriptional regulator YiaG